MKKLIVCGLLLCLVLPLAAVHAEEATFTAETIRIPAYGEKLEEPVEVFHFEGFTFSIYGMDKTEDSLVVYAHVKNDSEETVSWYLRKRVYAGGSVTNTLALNSLTPYEPHQEGDETFVMESQVKGGYTGLNGMNASVTFEVLLVVYPSVRDVLCDVNVQCLIGEATPYEVEINNYNEGGYCIMPLGNTTAFSANDISVGISMRVVSETLFEDLVLPLIVVNRSGRAARVALEDIVVAGNAVENSIEAVVEAGARMDTPWKLPMEQLLDMTCTLAVYDAETGELVFDKVLVIVHAADKNNP